MNISPFKSIPLGGLKFYALNPHHQEALLNLILAFDATYSPRGLFSKRIAQQAVDCLYSRYLGNGSKSAWNHYWLIFHVASQTYIGGVGLGPKADTSPEAGIAAVRDILIHPQWQGAQLGQALLSWMIHMAQRQGYLQLYLEAETCTTAEGAYLNHRDAGLRFFRNGKKLRLLGIPSAITPTGTIASPPLVSLCS